MSRRRPLALAGRRRRALGGGAVVVGLTAAASWSLGRGSGLAAVSVVDFYDPRALAAAGVLVGLALAAIRRRRATRSPDAGHGAGGGGSVATNGDTPADAGDRPVTGPGASVGESFGVATVAAAVLFAVVWSGRAVATLRTLGADGVVSAVQALAVDVLFVSLVAIPLGGIVLVAVYAGQLAVATATWLRGDRTVPPDHPVRIAWLLVDAVLPDSRTVRLSLGGGAVVVGLLCLEFALGWVFEVDPFAIQVFSLGASWPNLVALVLAPVVAGAVVADRAHRPADPRSPLGHAALLAGISLGAVVALVALGVLVGAAGLLVTVVQHGPAAVFTYLLYAVAFGLFLAIVYLPAIAVLTLFGVPFGYGAVTIVRLTWADGGAE